MISLDDFKVLKKLLVSDVQIESKRVKATYSVEKSSGEIQTKELVYSYEKPIFEIHKPSDVNLASMMLAQVALNYGLFFEEIQFDGLYDKIDQQFLNKMMENTSREIYTNKLLVKNEFLKTAFDTLKPEVRDRYTQAEITFTNTKFKHLKITKENNDSDFNKYAILSSGGKDSLLTYGIIKEIGEPHPVFINESGRHWFTAVNAHRHYKTIEPNTEKPWCNSDRLFNWMLTQLPFIKENYKNIRADIYPVRLWTVAVFLFGVLPIARKKSIGNILIGNEYDTTVVSNLEGITHYNALYDQSKYFDNALTRYYQAKGWKINQYSILRSLSELLIMKVLIKRYPELQKHQVSCHAAHEKDGRMYPCGKCEKCRRIIGMIKALDEDPKMCGYSEEQINNGLKTLSAKSVKQIGSDAAHLYHLLLNKKLIEQNEFTTKVGKSNPEILKLRFDRERSHLEDLPKYIRQPLFDVFKEYADGVIVRSDKKWQEKELNTEFINQHKYKYEKE
jgi:hypothetical protein